MNAIKRFVFYNVFPIVGKMMVGNNKYINVIYYHDIVPHEGDTFMRTNIEIFKTHMNYILANGYETIRFDDFSNVSKLSFKKKRVLIAFDDGWISNFTEIFSWMKERNIKYNIFLTIGEIGNNPQYLTWDMVRTMQQSGFCGFGAHTYTHQDMSDINKIDMSIEINKANEKFVQELGYEPLDFCYPFGFYSEESNVVLTKNTSYQRIYTSRAIYSYDYNGRIIFGRNAISNDYSFSHFKDCLNGYYNNVYEYITHLFKYKCK